jgi:Cu(I)/Ag(I) efflux system protein CusF
MKTGITALAAAALALGAAPLIAQTTDHGAHHPPAATQAPAAGAMADGEVRRVDKEAKKITIRHGPIPNLDMPPMTMVFQVTDPAMLDRVKVGDKIRFGADKAGSAYTVTRIELAK